MIDEVRVKLAPIYPTEETVITFAVTNHGRLLGDVRATARDGGQYISSCLPGDRLSGFRITQFSGLFCLTHDDAASEESPHSKAAQYQQNYRQRVKAQNHALREENVTLREENHTLREKNHTLREEKNALREENDALRSAMGGSEQMEEAQETEKTGSERQTTDMIWMMGGRPPQIKQETPQVVCEDTAATCNGLCPLSGWMRPIPNVAFTSICTL
ncbi:hypothetical protein FE257_002184 [Aspergillus nanangensis]|uniref:Uncharacterized protein n=1 Tax=Aspergillus nanangensis TaxID=2582783 RepID=A0AAD4CE62_ASPNN|nr:hypothetical protein FE257_002184 [Aspergillus nanangensis]